jgi:hypothetical protein
LSVEADRRVSLRLVAVVDPVVNIFRIDDGGDVDVFSGDVVRFRVVSNTERGVEVVFVSENGWKLRKADDKTQEIEYECLFNEKSVLDSPITVDYSEFQECQYEFTTSFRVKDLSKRYSAGKYRDDVTISVKSLN